MELQIAFAARAKRDRRAVGTSSGMTEEGADFVGGLGRENVLELAGLLLDLRFAVESQAVGEQALGQAVAANDVGRPQSAARSKFHDQAAITCRHAGWLESVMARVHERLVIMRFWRMWSGGEQSEGSHLIHRDADRQCAVNFQMLDFGDLSVLLDRP